MPLLTRIEEFPLPLNDDELSELITNHPYLRDVDPDMGVDEFHDQYVNIIAESHNWIGFRLLGGLSDQIYFWQRECGEGIAVSTDAWAAGNFMEIAALTREAIRTDQDTPSDDPVTTDGDCPYCGGELLGSTSVSGSYEQWCENGCDRQMIG